ncbi:50S ribosomal protein L28 [bacterium]|nr:50S ribosomal protein L28 [bacterium]
MANRCEICGKGPMFGNKRSHANNATKRRWNPNLHQVRALVDGNTKKMKICSGCLKAGKITKAG